MKGGIKIKNLKKNAMFFLFVMIIAIAISGTTAAAHYHKDSNSTNNTNPVISGNVITCSDSEPFSGVTITVTSNKQVVGETETDENGYYSITLSGHKKTYDVTASYPGHESITQQVKIDNNNFATANFQLGPRNATYTNLKNGYYQQLYIRDHYGGYYSAGTMQVTIDGVSYDAYCIDLFTSISSGKVLLVNGALVADGTGSLSSGVDWSKVNYILNTFSASGTINGSTNKAYNGAAIQAAIWYFTTAQYGTYSTGKDKYQFMTDPITGNYDAKLNTNRNADAVRKLATYIINQANSTTFNYPVSITLSPETSTLHNGDTLPITVTVYDQNNNPLSGITLNFSTDKGTLSTNTGTTNGQGQFTFNLTTDGLTSGTASILAWITGNYGTLLYYNPTGTALQDLTTTTMVPYSIQNSATITFAPSLEITKTGYYNPYCNSIVWRINTTNYSSTTLNNVVISDLIDSSSLTQYWNYYVSYDNGSTWVQDGTYNSTTGNWIISQLTGKATYSLILYATPLNGASTTYTNTATSTYNNVSYSTTASVYVPSCNPEISQTAEYSNNQIIWTITATNNGPDAANFYVWDEMGYDSPDTSYANYQVSYDGGNTWIQDGSYNSTNGLWTINGLENGAKFMLRIYATPTQGTENTYTNTAVDNYGNEASANVVVS